MSYKEFLDIVCKLYEKRLAKFFLEDQLIEIRWAQEKLIVITKIFTGREVIPTYISDCLTSLGSLKWEENRDEIYMDKSSGNLFYKRTLSPRLMYTYFRTEFADYLNQVSEWKSFFRSHAEKERFLTNII